MHTKTIYLIRHGETEYNRIGVVQGSGIDSDLNETGIAQARAFFEAYQHINFDKIYTSKLRRTVQSVQNFIDLGIPYEQHEGLNEISWGEKEGKVPNYLEDKYYLEVIANWGKGKTDVPAAPQGESPEEVVVRQKVAFEKILSRSEEKTILVAMHGRAIRILLTHLLDLPLSEMDTFEHTNLCLYRLSYHNQTQKFQLEVSNDVAHLSTLLVE
ncbi:2,3-bisphosphoglycerate-dependent phosphoglycerate mutase [Emticicia aquatica]|uniref:2,3-bisphosphoglycerate-dependent phosphoglycerate mutase n=1 Tax=Emticicia aquatica TaxID=1681835 RepID=A0ABM9APQ5_9BACT|nr:histidine phosphatase family protein [Emticicia aquatica]CAH0995776.1 2,3-bisphosphoglycerate-dependent phosphoglycerate mutase [Emticicia aquatica]